MSFRKLRFEFLLSHVTIRAVIYETCNAIWEVMAPIHFPPLTPERMRDLAMRNQGLWEFPNVWGAVDGKHIRLKAPPNSGSLFYNYKLYLSLVLQGIADADRRFVHVSVGALGRESDGGVFARSTIGRALNSGTLDVPRVALPNSDITCKLQLVGNTIVKPLRSPPREETGKKRILN